MASLCVLAFDQEGGPLQLNTWLDDLQLYLLSDSRDSVSLFDDTSGAAPTPPATADNATRSQWLTRDAASRLAIRNHLPLAECAHFGQHRTPQTLYDAVVARYSSPATTALGRLLLPYLFPELSAFATIKDLVSHLRASNARYRAALPAEFLDKNPPLMYIALYFIVTRLPESLRSNRDHSLDPTSLIVDLLEQHLLATETRAVATSLVLRMSGLLLLVRSAAAARARVAGVVGAALEAVAAVEVVAAVGVVEGVGALEAAMEAAVGVAVVAAVAVVAVGLELRVEVLEEASGNGSCVRARSLRPSSFVSGLLSVGRLGVVSGDAIFDLDYDAILFAMYALSASAEGDCYRCVSPNPGIDAAALCASESLLPGTAPAEALHTFTPDSGASRCFFRDSTTLTPLPALVPVRLADPSRGPVVARSFTVLLCPAVLSGSLSDLHLPSFSTNLVGTAALQDAMVTTTTPQGQRVWICTCTRTVRHLAMFTRRPRSSLYTLATQPPQVAASAQVSVSRQVAPPCSCRLLSHQTLLWHHRLGHPSLPRLRGMHSRLLVSGLPQSLPPLPPSPAPPCLPCIEGWQRAAPHSSSFPRTTAPLHTLHMDVWSPAHISGQDRKRYFLLVIEVLIPWIRAVCLQLRERFRADLRVLRLHSDRGGEFSCNLLRDFCRGEGILQSFTLPHSPQQNGIAKRRIGLVMEPCVSLAETSPKLCWTGKVGHASVFQVWGSCAFVRDTSADKLSARALPCVFLGFTPHSVPFYRLFPYRSAPPPPPPLFLSPGPPPVDPLPPQGLAPSGVSLPGTLPAEVAVGLGAARGAASGGAVSGSPAGASLRLSLQKLREWLVRCPRLRSGATGAGDVGAAGAGGAGVTAEAGGTGGTAATCPGGARTRGTGAARTGGVRGAGAGDPTEHGAIGAGGSSAGGAGAEGARAGGTGAGGAGAGGGGVGGTDAGGAGAGGTDVGGAGVGGTGAGGAGAGGAGAVDSRDTVRARPYFVPLLQQVLDVPSSPVLGLVLTLPHLLTA
ncbi:unnamed protein product [Closterium sp. NIES-53]